MLRTVAHSASFSTNRTAASTTSRRLGHRGLVAIPSHRPRLTQARPRPSGFRDTASSVAQRQSLSCHGLPSGHAQSRCGRLGHNAAAAVRSSGRVGSCRNPSSSAGQIAGVSRHLRPHPQQRLLVSGGAVATVAALIGLRTYARSSQTESILSTESLESILSRVEAFVDTILRQNALSSNTASCEAVAATATDEQLVVAAQDDSLDSQLEHQTFGQQVARILRIIRRLFQLTLVMSPVILLYPLAAFSAASRNGNMLRADDDSEKRDAQQVVLSALDQAEAELPPGFLGWYYTMCLRCVEWSGAAMIKMMQWAGSRPDMFGNDFCAVFSKLQDDTTPHHWKHTEKALRDAFGDDWSNRVELHEILGSGCIAQVYKGTVVGADGRKQQVAVKVMHPNVQNDIEADLDLMRLGVRLIQKLPLQSFQNLRWLNLEGAVEELADMLRIQLDLRTEARNLERFNENFRDDEYVRFPKLVEGYAPTRTVLTETFCEGIPVLEFAKSNVHNDELRTRMCKGAIRAVCKMIFLHNFVHGDLHPGNILVSKDYKFVLLDVGIVTENTPRDHALISDILAAFIRKNGRRAGRLAIDDSNTRLSTGRDKAVDEERFIDKIEALTIRASGKDYLMEHLGVYIAYICNAAAQHHVMMNQAFVSMCLAVKIQEGVALALDPSIEIWRVAIPIILEGERKRGMVTKRAKEILGVEDFMSRIFGRRSTVAEERRAS